MTISEGLEIFLEGLGFQEVLHGSFKLHGFYEDLVMNYKGLLEARAGILGFVKVFESLCVNAFGL